MFRINLYKKSKIILFILLIVLNFILRIPSIPHEKGGDSFYIHMLSNTITSYGHADWWVNWLSVFGLYPYSYASAIPFSLSGLSQLTGLTGIEMEKTILLYSILLGLFSIFTIYVLAGTVYDDFLFKYFMALFYSISQGIMVFTTWEISTRGPFLIFFTLAIFILLRKLHYAKTIILLISISTFLAATHHYFFFFVPLIGLFLILKIILDVKLNLNLNRHHYLKYLYIVGFIVSISTPFFTGSMIESGSRYSWIIDIIIISIRYIGPMIVFVLGGITYLIWREDKKLEEHFFLIATISLIPFIYNQIYGIYILIVFIIFFISIGFKNVLNKGIYSYHKIYPIFIIILLLTFTAFTAFYNHARTGSSERSSLMKQFWYMEENTYNTAQWGNNYISDEQIGVGNGIGFLRIVAASSGHPRRPTENLSEIKLIKVSPLSAEYYFEGPYVTESGTSLSGLISWLLEMNNIDDKRAVNIINKLEAKYIIEDAYDPTEIGKSLPEKKNKVYDSGRYNIYPMNLPNVR